MVSFRGQKTLAHAQVGFLKGFYSKFPMSIPTPFIWESPPRVKNLHIAWQRDTSQKIAKTLSGEAALVALFPFNLWERVSHFTSGARVPI